MCMYFQGQGTDWQDFVGIICLLLINSTVSFIEENNAGNAAAALMARLAPKTKVSYSTSSRNFRRFIYFRSPPSRFYRCITFQGNKKICVSYYVKLQFAKKGKLETGSLYYKMLHMFV